MILKQALIIFVLTITNACASIPVSSYSIDDELVPYVQEFMVLNRESPYLNKIDTSSVHFDDLTGNNIGICYGIYLQHTSIYIDRTWWKTATPRSKQMTVYHELGHCICNRQHTSSTDGIKGFFEELMFAFGLAERKGYLPDGCPASLMHPVDLGENCIDKHYYYYIEEMQQGCVK